MLSRARRAGRQDCPVARGPAATTQVHTRACGARSRVLEITGWTRFGVRVPRTPTFRSVDSCAGVRTRSDQSVTSGALLSAVHVSPKNWKVVRPRGSQRGSRPHMTPGTVTPWSSSPTSDLRPARGPRPALPRPLPRTRLLPNLVTDGLGQGRLRVYMNHAPLPRRLPAATDGLDRFRESQILLRRVRGRTPALPPAYRSSAAQSRHWTRACLSTSSRPISQRVCCFRESPRREPRQRGTPGGTKLRSGAYMRGSKHRVSARHRLVAALGMHRRSALVGDLFHRPLDGVTVPCGVREMVTVTVGAG